MITNVDLELDQRSLDNEVTYVQVILSALEYSDPNSSITMRKVQEGYRFNITPSSDMFRQEIIDNLLYLHREMHIPIKYSKSLERSKIVSFTV